MNVRRATKEDCDLFYEIYVKSVNSETNDFYSIKDLLTIFNYSIPIIVENCGVLLAFDMGVWCYVDILCVKEECRNKKVASLMLEKLVELSPERWTAIELCYRDEDEKLKFFLSGKGFENKFLYRWAKKPLRTDNGKHSPSSAI